MPAVTGSHFGMPRVTAPAGGSSAALGLGAEEISRLPPLLAIILGVPSAFLHSDQKRSEEDRLGYYPIVSPFWGARPAVVARGTTATRMAAGIYGPPVTDVMGPGYRVQGSFRAVGPVPAQIEQHRERYRPRERWTQTPQMDGVGTGLEARALGIRL